MLVVTYGKTLYFVCDQTIVSFPAFVAVAVLNRSDTAFPLNVETNLLSHKVLIIQKAVVWGYLYCQWIGMLTS
jgi:hypothetical protein